jgi:hypothetical protein
MGLFGIIRKILKDFDPSKLKLRDVNVYFLLSYLKGHHIIQSVGGVCFLGVYTYASDRLNISFGMQLTFWGVFLWNLMMTAVYFDAVLEYHKEIVFSDVEVH